MTDNFRAGSDNKRIVNRYSRLVERVLPLARIYMEHLAEFRPLEVDREITRTVMDLLRRWRAKLLDYTRLCGLREVYLCTLPATVYFEQRDPRQFVERQTLRIFVDMNFRAFRTDWRDIRPIRFSLDSSGKFISN